MNQRDMPGSAFRALDQLPPAFDPPDLAERVKAAVAASGRKLVALDDDPTGVQTVYDTPVLARWDVDDLVRELRDPWPVCFLLTNSRGLPEERARRVNQEIATALLASSVETGREFVVASRSDSTLRGHFPAETDTLTTVLGAIDGVLLVPAFFEGGRFTIDDTHLVQIGDQLVPAAETEFARDPTFGYRSSNLRAWIAEKSAGRISAAEVGSIGLDDIRRGGPTRVTELLLDVHGGSVGVVNAAGYADLAVVVLGLLAAEARGKRFVYRTAASFVRVRAGLDDRPLLTREELLGVSAPVGPGLVVVGSHVQRSSQQLDSLLALTEVDGIELEVAPILAGHMEMAAIAAEKATASLAADRTAVLFTSREVVVESGDQLQISAIVSAALVAAVRAIRVEPRFIIGKGGITSSDIGTKALDARRAVVLGQIRPGVPVWRLGPEARYPGLPYIVFPGNVGEITTLAEIVSELRGSTAFTA
ncbi:MAG: hydroxyacid dehydrogenase [Chloroflexota bacterium]|nr:hydroxyacid dehydrogenase [Chloroflexota bacterium]